MADASQSGTFRIGGELAVHRLGFGAMRITGPGIWGPPKDKAEALGALQRSVGRVKATTGGGQLKALRCDNGGEFTSEVFKRWCEEQGLVLEYTAPYSLSRTQWLRGLRGRLVIRPARCW